MNQFLNNIWIALSMENLKFLNIIFIPFGFIEHYLFMDLFLTLFNVKCSKVQKLYYILSILTISLLSSCFVPSPFNVIINYTCFIVLVYFIFKLGLLQSFTSLLVPSFIFGLLNTLFQNPYLRIFNITPNQFLTIPIYRVPYLLFLYFCMFLVNLSLKKFKKIKFNLTLLDNLDRKTKLLLATNIILGFLTICIQLLTTAFYIYIVPIFMSILNFILLIAFFMLCVYSFTHMIKLANTRKDLECAEDYNKSLEILYDKVKGFKHDFDNIVSTLDGYIETNDMLGLKNYFNEVKKDCKITNNLSIINPRTINNPGIYSLLNNKYFKATNLGINFDFEYFIDLNKIDINLYQFSRVLGILIDNAIEEAEKCSEKIVKLSFIRENRNNRAVLTVQNTYLNKNVDISKIFNKGESGKENHSGIGLWEVKKYVEKSRNLDLFTTKNNTFFKQELCIYDLPKK